MTIKHRVDLFGSTNSTDTTGPFNQLTAYAPQIGDIEWDNNKYVIHLYNTNTGEVVNIAIDPTQAVNLARALINYAADNT